MTSKHQMRIDEIIDQAVDYIPNPTHEVWDPKDGLEDTLKAVKTIYQHRLKHYITSKDESVRFVYRLAEFLKAEYPKKPEKEYKPRKKVERSPEYKEKAKERLWLSWAPGGKKFLQQSPEWMGQTLLKYEKGGELYDRLKIKSIKSQFDAYKKSAQKKSQ